MKECMSSKLKDKESKSLLENKVFQAGIIVSIILLSSAIFVSQTDRIFGKAAAGMPITGTIVLFDQGNSNGISTKSYFSKIYLPKASCIAYANYCFGDTAVDGFCRSKQIFSPEGDNLFTIELIGPGIKLGQGGSCGTSYTKQQENSYILATCKATSSWHLVESKIIHEGFGSVVSCRVSSPNRGYVRSVSNSNMALGSAGSVFTGMCDLGAVSVSTGVEEYSGDLGGPLGHLDVTYECP